jgi:hypothetical protein
MKTQNCVHILGGRDEQIDGPEHVSVTLPEPGDDVAAVGERAPVDLGDDGAHCGAG